MEDPRENNDLLESLQEDSESVEDESGLWEDLDPCSIGNAVLYELERDPNPSKALQTALKSLSEDPSYFIEPNRSDYEEIRTKKQLSEVSSEETREAWGDGVLQTASLDRAWPEEFVSRLASALASPDHDKLAFLGPEGYINNFGAPHESEFFSLEPDLYPEDHPDNDEDYTDPFSE